MRYSKIPLLSPKAIHLHSAQSFINYLKTLKQRPESKTLSKVVEGINISNAKRLMIKVSRENKIFTEEEIDLLINEFKLEKASLLEALMKRKIEVKDVHGAVINPKPTKFRKARNAKHKPATRRKKKDSHKQFEPGPDSELPKESLV